MSQPYVGEIRMFGGNFAPAGWAFCDGQLMPISENEALFNLIGTTYGGDGQSTFGLPDLQGRVPIHMGQGPGLSNYVLAEKAGVENVTIATASMPNHTHPALCNSGGGSNVSNPAASTWTVSDLNVYSASLATSGNIGTSALISTPIGGSQPHDNMIPFLVINYIISLFGIFPSPN